MAKLLIVASTGAQDATRASIPFPIAANGAIPAGQACGIALAGDATELLKREIIDRVKGVGVPPLADLLAACAQRGESASTSERAAPRPGGSRNST